MMRRNPFTHRSPSTNSQDHQTKLYHGLADAFGLESLMAYDENQVPLLIVRSSVYRYRHCLYFQVSLDRILVTKIRSLMKKGASDEALNLLKERAPIIHIPKEFLDSWELIPDQRLDPFKNYTWLK